MSKFEVGDIVQPYLDASKNSAGALKYGTEYSVSGVEGATVQVKGVPGWYSERSFELVRHAPRVQGPQTDEHLANLKYKVGDVVEITGVPCDLGSEGVVAHVGAPNGDDYVVRFPKQGGATRTFNEASLTKRYNASESIVGRTKSLDELMNTVELCTKALLVAQATLRIEVERLKIDVDALKRERS